MDAEKRWLSVDGPEFIRKIGIKKGHTVVDFGCGHGHYTIPVARAVQAEGRVYALDNDEEVIRKIKKKAAKGLFGNIVPLLVPKDLSLGLEKGIADVVLLYDVLHYLKERERNKVYAELHRILKNDGLLSVYPKHYKSDSPMWSLADMDIEDIIKEITVIGFCLQNTLYEKLFHFHSYTSGHILTLRKVGKEGP